MGNKVGVFHQSDVEALKDHERKQLRETTLKWLVDDGHIEKIFKNDPTLVTRCRDKVKEGMEDVHNTLMQKMRSRGESV